MVYTSCKLIIIKPMVISVSNTVQLQSVPIQEKSVHVKGRDWTNQIKVDKNNYMKTQDGQKEKIGSSKECLYIIQVS